jgi:hypothetical protein
VSNEDRRSEQGRKPRPNADRGLPRSSEGGDGECKPHLLFGALRGLGTVAPGVDLTEPADPEWSQRIDGGEERRPKRGGRSS